MVFQYFSKSRQKRFPSSKITPKLLQDGSKILSRGSQEAPKRLPRGSQDLSKRLQERSKRLQERSKRLQDASSSLQDHPNDCLGAFQSSQMSPKKPLEASKRLQEASKRFPRAILCHSETEKVPPQSTKTTNKKLWVFMYFPESENLVSELGQKSRGPLTLQACKGSAGIAKRLQYIIYRLYIHNI